MPWPPPPRASPWPGSFGGLRLCPPPLLLLLEVRDSTDRLTFLLCPRFPQPRGPGVRSHTVHPGPRPPSGQRWDRSPVAPFQPPLRLSPPLLSRLRSATPTPTQAKGKEQRRSGEARATSISSDRRRPWAGAALRATLFGEERSARARSREPARNREARDRAENAEGFSRTIPSPGTIPEPACQRGRTPSWCPRFPQPRGPGVRSHTVHPGPRPPSGQRWDRSPVAPFQPPLRLSPPLLSRLRSATPTPTQAKGKEQRRSGEARATSISSDRRRPWAGAALRATLFGEERSARARSREPARNREARDRAENAEGFSRTIPSPGTIPEPACQRGRLEL
ncbi:hypothetical protein H920_15022 [Fukomys damarensis]|uniref:Uncharacterized protein n=1 Tax=Fukomys damarensis TaxID=885580 RepID=A0A091CZU3_FUKDA|nr:hypothetical protein H920_15022 [Fukomys damarensis]